MLTAPCRDVTPMPGEAVKFFRKLMHCLPLVVSVLAVNALFGPIQLLDITAHIRAARGANGETLIAGADENDRQELRARVALMPAAYDVIVLGSSRSLQIYGGMFPGKTFLNASVYGGQIRDEIGIYELLREQGRLPKILIVNLDPQTIQTPTPTGYRGLWLAVSGEYYRAMARMGLNRPIWDSWAEWANKLLEQVQLVSPVLLQQSLAHAFQWSTAEPFAGALWDMEHPHPTFAIRMPDRALVYSQQMSAPTRTQLEASAMTLMGSRKAGPNQQRDLNAQREFETFVRAVHADGVQLIFFLAPFHPLYTEHLNGTPGDKFLQETEEYYNTFARELHIAVVGSFRAQRVSCGENDFFDVLHPLGRCVIRIWRDARARGIVP